VTAVPAVVGRQVRWEQRMFWRNPASAAFTFAFPLVFLVIFTAINGNSTVHIPGGTVKFAQYYVPSIVAFGIISACYTNLAFNVCVRRESGILKRVRGTPLPTSLYFAGLVGNSLIIALILTGLTTGLGVVAYGVIWPGRYLGLVVTVAAGAFCFCAAGVAVATFVPNEDAAPAVINFLLFPLLFISGTFGTVDSGSTLGRIAAVFPIRHLLQQMVSVFNPRSSGTGIVATHTAVLLAWGVGLLVVGTERFRWEPRSG